MVLILQKDDGPSFIKIRMRFQCFLKRRNGPTDLRTDGLMDRPSYRDERTHLKTPVLPYLPIFTVAESQMVQFLFVSLTV